MSSKSVHRTFDGMCWPAPCEALSEVAWRLIWQQGEVSRTDRLLAASVISAYRQMIRDPEPKRRKVIRELRQGPNLPRSKS